LGIPDITVHGQEGAAGGDAPSENTTGTEGRNRTQSLATYAAVIALGLLLAGIVLQVIYTQTYIDHFRDGYDSEGIESVFQIAKASTYAGMFGELAAILGLVLLAHGEFGWLRSGVGLVVPSKVKPVTVIRLLLLALVLSIVSAALFVIVYESDLDWGSETIRWVFTLSTVLRSSIWVVGTIVLLIVTNGLRRGGNILRLI
jgi:hypothetical protein